MFRNLLIISGLLSITFFAYADKKDKQGAGTSQKSDSVNYKEIGAPMPQLQLELEGGKVLTNKSVQNKANLLVVMYNPLCEHCQEQTSTLIQNIHLFKKTKALYLTTAEMWAYVNLFETATKYSRYPQLVVGIDRSGFGDKVFLYQPLPQINIYDAERKLIKVFTGGVPIDSLKPYIQ